MPWRCWGSPSSRISHQDVGQEPSPHEAQSTGHVPSSWATDVYLISLHPNQSSGCGLLLMFPFLERGSDSLGRAD